MLNKEDVAIVRELAARVAEIAALPVQDEKRALWHKLNARTPARPMVMIDQVCWNEMETGDELRLKGKGLSVLRSGSRGDLFVEVAVEIPVNLSKRQQELLKEFESAGDARKTQPQSAGFFAKVKEFFGDLRE